MYCILYSVYRIEYKAYRISYIDNSSIAYISIVYQYHRLQHNKPQQIVITYDISIIKR